MHSVTSIHWGFSIGGVGKYAAIIDKVHEVSDVDIHSIVILSPSVHVDDDTMNMLGHLHVIRLRSKFDISWLWKLRRLLKEIPPEAVLTHGFNGHFLMLIERYVLRLKLPLLCSYHGQYHATTSIRRGLGVVFNSFTEFYIRHCVQGVIVVADYCRVYLNNKGVDESKIEVIHNGIKNDILADGNRGKLREGWGVADNEVLFGVASRIDPVKGIEYLLDAFIGANEKYQNIKLVIIGTGTLEQKLKSVVSEHKLDDRVIFTGFRSDINDCLSAIDVFVLPSLAEYHSIALLEAMRAKMPIISSDVGGNTESVRNRKEALIVRPANVDDLEQAIATMMEDDALRNELAINAYNRFQKEFTEEKTIEKTARWLSRYCV